MAASIRHNRCSARTWKIEDGRWNGFGSTDFSLCAFPLAQPQTTQTEVCATCVYCSIFASSSTNFCWRWDWSLPSSDSACCVMFIEQNFGPHIEQNFASL